MFGSGKGFADGASDTAKFSAPFGICLIGAAGGGSKRGVIPVPVPVPETVLICADSDNDRRQIALLSGVVSTHAGSGQRGFAYGTRTSAALHSPYSVCADPIKPGCYYLADTHTIRYCDDKSVTLIAGSVDGHADGVGAPARPSYMNM